jgi:HlyD family secretion protein
MAQALPSHMPGPARVVDFPTRRPPRWRWALPGALLLVAAVAGVLYMTGQLTSLQQRLTGTTAAPTYQTAAVSKGSVAETVTATGPIAAAQTVTISPEAAGTLVDLKVSIGQTIKKGDVLAQLDTTDLDAALEQAKASLAQAEASYAKAQQGATPEERAAAQVSLENAQRAADDASKNAAASTTSAQRDVESAAVSIGTARTSVQTAQDSLAAAQAQMETKLASDRLAIQNAEKSLAAAEAVVAAQPAIQKEQLDAAKTSLWAQQISRDQACGRAVGCETANAQVAASETNVNTVAAQAIQAQKQSEQTLGQAQAAVETARAALANDQVSLAASVKSAENAVKAAQAQVASAQASAAKAQSAAAASAQSAQASANGAQNQVKSAQASLAQTVAGPAKADVDVAAAQVANARVTVRQAENNLAAATLKAPIDGTVSAIAGAVGQQLPSGTPFVTLVTLQNLQVTAQVNEADVGKVTIGDPVKFTVSAFPGKTFTGAVTQIQPTGTTTSNVVSFAVTSSIGSAGGTALYPGMTATVTVTTDERKDVLLVPTAAIANGAVRVLQDGQPAQVKVTTGLSDGANTEVVAGLQDGQAVVTGQSGGATAARTTGTNAATRTGTQTTTNPLAGSAGPGFAVKP